MVAGHGISIAGIQQCYASKISPLLADGHNDAQTYVINQRWIETISLAQRGQHMTGQAHRRDRVEGAIAAPLTSGRTHVIVDEGFAHDSLLLS
ncbi:hypothetical protein D3C76_1512650 [compost metagenome]